MYDDGDSDSDSNERIINMLGGGDIENELYVNDGDEPEWMS